APRQDRGTHPMTDAKPTNELLPCPFCGKQPAARWISGSAPGMDDCGYYGIDCCRAHAHEDSEEEAVAAWNRRTPAPPSQSDARAEALAQLERTTFYGKPLAPPTDPAPAQARHPFTDDG